MKWMSKRKHIASSFLIGAVVFSFFPSGGIEAAPKQIVAKGESVFSTGSQQVESSNKLSLVQKSPILLAVAASSSEQRVIVTFKDKKKVNKALIQKGKGKIKRENKNTPSLSVSMPANEIEALKKDPSIESVEPDIKLQTASTQVMDWGVSVVNATYAWDNGYTGKGVKVAVLDTGIDTHHEDLVVTGGVSFVDYTTSYDDDSGHGTHVAGIIGAKNNEVGVVGVAPDADLYAVKVLDSTGKGYLSDVIAGIDWAVDNKMDIINMSMGTNVDSPALHQAVDQAYESGLLIVAAAGNTGNAEGTGDTIQYPAKYSSVIAVGAVDQNMKRASFSATGSELEVVAPGVGVRSTFLNNTYSLLNGSSMASAYISGSLAIYKQSMMGKEESSLLKYMLNNVLDEGEAGKDGLFGYGVLSVGNVTLSEVSNQMDDLNKFPFRTITDEVYSNRIFAANSFVPSVILKQTVECLGCTPSSYTIIRDETTKFPVLTNAKSSYIYNSGYYVLYSDNTVKVKRTVECLGCTPSSYISEIDVTSLFPDLINAKSIFIYNSGYYVQYYDNTVKVKRTVECLGCTPSTYTLIEDETSKFPDLVNSKSAFIYNSGYYVLYSDNTVKVKRTVECLGCTPSTYTLITDETSKFPDLVNSRSAFIYNSGYFVGYLDVAPKLLLNTNGDQTTYKNQGSQIILSGTASDPDNDNLVISANVAGVNKSINLSNTLIPQEWTLKWNIDTDNVSVGTFTNTTITVNDGIWGNVSATYTGTIVVDNVPNAPSALNPGTTVSTPPPTPVSGLTPLLNWTFTDIDAGDTQSAYNVLIYNAAGTTLISDSGWVNSGTTNYTIPAGKLARGTTYSWKVAVKDSKGGVSAFSPLYYIKTNNLPTATLTSYTDGQTLSVNVLNFTWNYNDADGQPQTKYQIQGSKDNWTTIGYDSGVVVSSTTTPQPTPAIADGTWSFKVFVYDGMEWSVAATRNSLIIPNGYEPNDTSAQAFLINYNTNYSSTINSTTDIDFFKYVPPATGIDRVTLSNVPSGQNYDVYVYDSNMKYVAAGLVTDLGGSEEIIYKVTGGSTYYVKVVGVGGGTSTSPYKLNVSKFVLSLQTSYQYDSNGNITSKQTATSFKQQPSSNKTFAGTTQLAYNNIAVNTAAGAKNTVSFWMNWDGTENVMPIGWGTAYNLFLSGGYFGFNTGEGNVLGISSAGLKNNWVYVTAVFTNGVPNATSNELYINGIKQTLTQILGSTTANRATTSSFFVSGWGADQGYKFKGKLGDVEVWNRALTQQEIQSNMNNNLAGTEHGLVGYWKITD